MFEFIQPIYDQTPVHLSTPDIEHASYKPPHRLFPILSRTNAVPDEVIFNTAARPSNPPSPSKQRGGQMKWRVSSGQ